MYLLDDKTIHLPVLYYFGLAISSKEMCMYSNDCFCNTLEVKKTPNTITAGETSRVPYS